MKAPVRRLVEALDHQLRFLPAASVRRGREHSWLHSETVREQLLHYGAWVNFWGISCLLVALAVPVISLLFAAHGEGIDGVESGSLIGFLLCFPAVMLAAKFAGDAFICLAANIVQRFAPGAGCSVPPRLWRFCELREAYAWYCGVPRYWVRRANRVLFLMAALGVCAACYL